jgi:iron complex transport system substrate-binding protein
VQSVRLSRRQVLTTGTAALTVGFAGCSGGVGGPGDVDGGSSSDAHTVEMAPVGEVSFDAVPERWLAYETGYAEMGVALGRADGLVAVGNLDRYHTGHYEELDNVDLDTDELTQLLGENAQIDGEIFYELDADLHLVDPNWLVDGSAFGLEEADVKEVHENVGPVVGNTVFRRTDEWHDYRYYTMYEAFEKVAEIFQERERYGAFAAFHNEYLARVEADLPVADDRPAALLTFADGDEPEQFFPYRLADRGTNNKQFHDLGVEDALAGTGISGLSTSDRGTIDYETVLEVDPDVLLIRGHEDKTHEEFADTVLGYMQRHDVASELTAVQEEQVFRGGPIYQGPVQHLFTLERAATELYPETFQGELFDRERVDAILAGDV